MSSPNSSNENKPLLGLVLLIAAAAILFLALDESPTSKQGLNQQKVNSEKFEKSVNKHLMLTNELMRLASERATLESNELVNRFSKTKPSDFVYTNDNTIDLSTDNRAADVADEIGRGKRPEDSSSPHDVVQRELFNEEQVKEYTQAYKAEYARQFIENARRGGYKVKLSDDYSRVLSVTPINPGHGNMELFNSGASSAQ